MQLARTSARRLRGQTLSLIETLVIVAIIAILAAVLIPKYLTVRQESQVAGSQSAMKNVSTALEMYYSIQQVYPTGSAATVNAALFGGTGNNYYNGTPTSPNGGGNYTFTNNAGGSPAYYVDDPGTYKPFVLSNLPKVNQGTDNVTGTCNGGCHNLEYNSDIGFVGY